MKGRKIILAGIIALLVGLILGNLGTETLGAVIYLLGVAGCIAGVIVVTVNVIRAWRKRRWERSTQEAEKYTTVAIEDEPGTPKTGLVIVAVCVALFFMSMDIIAKGRDNGAEFALIAVIGFVAGWVKWIYDFAQTHKSEKKKASEAAAKRLREEQHAAEQERYRLATTPVEVKLIGGSTEFKRGGLKGAMIGAFFGGGIGAVLGAVTRNGKAVHKQRFAVKYANGRTGTEEHEVGSRRYTELMRYVKWGDI